MILKNLTRRSNTHQLVNYLFKEKEKEKEKLQPVLKHNMRNRSIKGWAKELDKNESLRIHKRKDNIKLNHTIISFSNKDKQHITDKLLKDISKKYIELRGKDNIYLASSHHDKDHIHLHIVMSATKYMTGESNRISKTEFKELKLALDVFQREKYPELIHSLPNHRKSQKAQLAEKDHQLQRVEGNLSQKQQILDTVEAVYNKSKSVDDFLSRLKSEGINTYDRGGKAYGVEDESGRHYRFKTIGFDLKKLEELDRQAQVEAKELQELASLRDSKSQDREHDNERFEQDINEDDKTQTEDPESDHLEEETGTHDEDDLDTDDGYDD